MSSVGPEIVIYIRYKLDIQYYPMAQGQIKAKAQ